jgi:hypothetical protein
MRPTALNEHLSALLDYEDLRLAPLPPAAALGYWQDAAKARTSIPYRQLRQDHRAGCCVPCRPPRSQVLCKVLALTSVLLLLVHMVSCGLFFCVTLPFQRHNYVDLSELLAEPALLGGGSSGGSSSGAAGGGEHSSPKLIPRIIHQTFSSRQVPENAKAIMRSWREHNGNSWQIRFYDDQACLDFVRREFPEYLDAYGSLPKDVERSDFFRYMVVLRLGGVYADIDVECRQPLDRVIRPTDTMVVGWEAEVASDAQAYKRHFARKRQVLQWFFAAAPGHPALRQICGHIARNALRTFSNNTNRDTLERTGPGIWTDVVLRHSMHHPMHKVCGTRCTRPAAARRGARRPPGSRPAVPRRPPPPRSSASAPSAPPPTPQPATAAAGRPLQGARAATRRLRRAPSWHRRADARRARDRGAAPLHGLVEGGRAGGRGWGAARPAGSPASGAGRRRRASRCSERREAASPPAEQAPAGSCRAPARRGAE